MKKRYEDNDFIITGPDDVPEEPVVEVCDEEIWLRDDEEEERAEFKPHDLPVEKDTGFGNEEDDEDAEYESVEPDQTENPFCETDETEAGQAAAQPQGKRRRKLFGGDSVLWIIMIALLILSVFITFSAEYYKVASPARNLGRHLMFIGMGAAVLWLVHIIKYQFYRKIAKTVWISGLILTLAGAVYGYMLYKSGMRKTLDMRDLVVFGVSFQPLELLKIGMVMLLSMQLAGRQKQIDRMNILPSFRPSEWKRNAQEQVDILTKQTIPILGPVLVTCVVTQFVVGNSTTLIIGGTCFIMLLIGRVRRQDIVKMCGVLGGLVLILFIVGVGRSDTGKSRLARFTPNMHVKHATEITTIDLDGDTVRMEVYAPPIKGYGKDGKPITEYDQVTTAKMAIASGEFFGKGPGMSTLRSKLPEAEKDYAYALLIEEFGAVGGLLVMLLFLWLFFRTIQIFKKCGTAFPSLLILGLGVMITLQAMMHMLVNVGLFPVAGQQLPLISKGGSSLVFTLFALGMILGVSRQTANNTLDAPKDQSLFENRDRS